MSHRPFLFAFSVLFLVTSSVGCESRVSLGARCDSTALCPNPLVCGVGGRCRVQCLASTDCPVGERCLVDVAVGIAACSIERETCTTDCADGLECVAGECQSRCMGNVDCPDGECLPGGVCRAIASGADAGSIDDAGADAAAPMVDAFDPSGCRAAPEIADVDVGLESVCAVTSEGVVHCWGYYGAVGSLEGGVACAGRPGLTSGCYPRPVAIAGLPRLSHVTVGQTLACGISRDAATLDEVWCWGIDDTSFFVRAITDTFGVPIRARVVDAGRAFVCAITTEATPRVLCWGSQAHGALGDGVVDDGRVSVNAVVATQLGTPDADGLRVSAYATFVRQGSELRGVGQNDDSEIADPDTTSEPIAVARDLGAALMGIGTTADNTCVLIGTTTHCWGRHGNLSQPPVEPPGCMSGAQCTYEPTVFDTTPLVALAGDPYGDSMLGWNDAGVAYGWGSSFGGVLAAPDLDTIQPLTALGGALVVDLAVGDNTACAILRDQSELRCWGLNDDGQLGRGTLDSEGHGVAEPPCW